MDTKAVLMISMPVTELANLIEIAVDKVLDKRFSPLRRQFEDRLMTLKEAAQKLGVTDRTMNNLEKRGELIPTRIGAKVMYKESDITQYLNRKSQ